jgi:hypothetical protein
METIYPYVLISKQDISGYERILFGHLKDIAWIYNSIYCGI